MLRNSPLRHQPAATAPLDRNSAAAAPLDRNSAAAAPFDCNSAAAAPPGRNSAAAAPPARDSAVAGPQLLRHHTAATRHRHPSAAAAPPPHRLPRHRSATISLAPPPLRRPQRSAAAPRTSGSQLESNLNTVEHATKLSRPQESGHQSSSAAKSRRFLLKCYHFSLSNRLKRLNHTAKAHTRFESKTGSTLPLH